MERVRPSNTIVPATFPTPAKRTVRRSASSSAIAAAAPRVGRSASCSRARASRAVDPGAAASNTRHASAAAAAASGPWPMPSVTSTSERRASWTTVHASPHTSSPGFGTDTPSTSTPSRRGGAPDQRNETIAVPLAAEYASNVAESRRIAPRPVPGLPAVE
jgi:hypothetical protein